MKTKLATWGLALAGLFTLASCGGGGGIGGTGAPEGSLSVSVTDAPACGFDAVNVTIKEVRVHQSATATDTDGGWYSIVPATPRRINLLDLTNGEMEDLGMTSLPAGRYTQLRLVLERNGGNTPLANSVVPTGGTETALTTPSAAESGLKLNANIDVPAGQELHIALDFDACKSVVKRGNGNQYNLKPVISILPVLADAGLRVTGYVDPAIALTSTNVSLQLNGVPVRSTPPVISADPAQNGRFTLRPVPAGTYDLVITANGRVTAVMTGVPVVSGTPTQVSTEALRINPPLASMRTVTGTVAPATATVRALQPFTGGPTVEAAWVPVDALTGDFSVSLPIGAPVKTSYVANPTSLDFVADALSSRFTLEASSAGLVTTQDIDVSSAVAPVIITLP